VFSFFTVRFRRDGPSDPRSAHRSLARASFQRCDDLVDPLGIDGWAASALAPTPASGGKAGFHPLGDQCPLVLCQRAEKIEHEHPLRRGGVHLLRQGAKADAALLQVRDDPDEMGKGAAQPVQLPDEQHIAKAEVRQTRLQAQPVIACAGRAILMQMAVIDTGEEECIALQVNGLALVSGRDPHVTDQHVRQTPKRLLSHTGPIRQGMSRRKTAAWRATFRTQPMIAGINCLSSPSVAP